MTSRIVHAHIGHSLLSQLICKLLQAEQMQQRSLLTWDLHLLLCEWQDVLYCL